MVSLIVSLVVFVLVLLTSVASILIMHFYFKALGNNRVSAMGGVAFPSVALVPAGPSRIKQTKCRTCGGSKLKASKTAYVYCDFCGALADYDFRLAMSRGSAPPGPAYEALSRQEKPIQDMAKARGDIPALRASLARVFAGHMQMCPTSYSPRIGDSEYRRKLLDFTVECYLSGAMDSEVKRLEAVMTQSVKGLSWNHSMSGMRVEPNSFWAMTNAWLAHDNRFRQLASQHIGRYPEPITDGIMQAMGTSLFAQGWMSYLDAPEQERLLGALGLKGEYLELAPVQTSERHCGGCGQGLQVVQGAWKTVCEACGLMNDSRQGEIQCKSCGAPFCIPAERPNFACPYCKAGVQMAFR